jgi:hypothetical protein
MAGRDDFHVGPSLKFETEYIWDAVEVPWKFRGSHPYRWAEWGIARTRAYKRMVIL